VSLALKSLDVSIPREIEIKPTRAGYGQDGSTVATVDCRDRASRFFDVSRPFEWLPGGTIEPETDASTRHTDRIIGICDFWLKNVLLLGGEFGRFSAGTVGDMHVTELDTRGHVVHANFYPGGTGAGSGFGAVIRPLWKYSAPPQPDPSEAEHTSDMIDLVDAATNPGGRFIMDFLASLIGRQGQKVLPIGRTNVHVDVRVNGISVSFTEFYDGFIKCYTDNVEKGVREHIEKRCGDISDHLSRLEREMTRAAVDRFTNAEIPGSEAERDQDDPELLVEVGHPGHEQVRADTPEGRSLLNPGCRLVRYIPAARARRQP